MTYSVSDLINIAREARGPIESQMEAAEILAGLGKVCRDKGIDWSQLKALVKAQIRDEQDETGKGAHVKSILSKAENAAAYADLLAKMNKENFSDADVAGIPASATSGPENHAQRFNSPPPDDLSIPEFLRREPSGASA